ncbi:Xanthine dehydrogenase [Wickerhamiella sorbophila]|uniref:Xanthine dehydrogenase n=1 Tax=Wickerhamiella sorbophila TaxID=45607 RepID=A0A2T0FP04_9ASCO|nr:Xanthine dehydrogenase [Wickerhamiella sorbophila]PRT56689.1 Xanthine dehydrogenase [Wickerhamiella sorbophila]
MSKQTLEFYLNGKKQVLHAADPTMTALEYVRSVGLTGTKLGCQEGGCGACTMTISEWDPEQNKPKYYAINGCIVPLILVDGKHLITVEGIGNAENPHAVQERIAKFHGSQCGFCTPGIVMSLYSLLRNTDGKPSREQISEAFDGNLCRCTGYKPIIDAAETFVCAKGADCCRNKKSETDEPVANGNGVANGHSFVDDLATEIIEESLANGNGKPNGVSHSNGHMNGASECSKGANCCKKGSVSDEAANGAKKTFKTPNGLELKAYPHSELIFPPALRRYEYKQLRIVAPDGSVWYRPTTLAELLALREEFPTAKLIAGASEVQIEMRIRGDLHPVVIFVNDIPELKTFQYIPGKGALIGANLSLSDLEYHLEELISELGPEKSQVFMAITEQLKYFAGRQIRNVGTPAGNIMTASPIADLNPILVAADARLYFEGREPAERTMGDFENPFFTGYRKTTAPDGATLVRVLIPESTPKEVVRAYKQAKRKDDDISIVTACMRATVVDGVFKKVSLAYGGVAPITVLAKSSLKIVGEPVDDNVLGIILNELDQEFKLPYSVPGGMAVFRRSLILSFFYKFLQSAKQMTGGSIDMDSLAEVTRNHPIGVRDLDNDYEQRILGKAEMHLSALKQVTGEAIYVDDMPPFHNEVHAVQVMSTKARAKIANVDTSAALELPGVIGYVDVNDVPGHNTWGIFPFGKDYFFADGEVHYVGQTIGVICATDRETAARASRLVKVEYYDEEEPIVTIEQAIERKSFFEIISKVDNDGVDEAFEKAHRVLKGQSRMGAQEHFYLETQGCIVVPQEGREYKVYASSQNPRESQALVAEALNIPASLVVAHVKRLGGGFGGKETRACHYNGIAAICAHKFKRPVRFILSRSEDMQQAGQRHPFLCNWEVALDENNKFVGLKAEMYANAGYSMDLTKGVIDRAVLHIDNCYDFGKVRASATPCKTNIASNTAYRGFGGPQGMFFAESIIYEVADALKVDPDDLRRINYYPEKNGVTPYGQNMGEDFTASLMARQLMEEVNYDQLRIEVEEFNAKSKWIKRGLAHVPTKFGIAFGVQFLNQAGALVHIYVDGSILLTHGGTEMGQGLHTKMAMIAAQELGVSLDEVFISETATNTVANASPSAASASADLNGMAVKNACDQLNERLKPYREKLGPNATMNQMAFAAYKDRVNLSANGFYKTPDIIEALNTPGGGQAFSYYTQGNSITMVEVNTLTGDWANLRTDIKMDIGRTLNLAIDYGQIEGAFVQGQGLFTMEESLWLQTGAIFTRGPGAYKIPGFSDIPQHFNVSVLRGRDFHHLKSIHRSKGIGEPPLFLGCSAFFAIRDALKYAREDRNLAMLQGIDAPMTTERIRVAVGDELLAKAQVEVVGPAFTVRS